MNPNECKISERESRNSSCNRRARDGQPHSGDNLVIEDLGRIRLEEVSVADISIFCYQDEEDGDETNSDTEESDWHYSHTPLIKQSNASSNRIVEARQTMNSSLVLENCTNQYR